MSRARAGRLGEPHGPESDEDLAFEILSAASAPITSAELVERMERHGWRSRTRFPASSLGVKLNRDPRFEKHVHPVDPHRPRRWSVRS